jgi:uncharacterized protein (TIGR03067 family)
MKNLLAVLAVGLLLAADRPGDGAGGEKDLQGTWKRTSPQPAAGVPLTGEGVTQYGLFIIGVGGTGKIDIKGDKLTVRLATGMVELKLTLDPAKSPKTVDAKGSKGEVVFRGIYEVGKDSLRLCISPTDERPKEFKDSSRTPLMEFKRE